MIKHKFQTQKADGTDVTLVKPTNWNDDHDFTTAADGVAIGRAAGAGPGPVQELPLSALMPVGVMLLWPGDAAPAGWMICAGQSLATANYPVLVGIIGYAYGGTGGNFNIPDMRGRVAAGVDGGVGRLTSLTIGGRGPNQVGGSGGLELQDRDVVGANLSVGVAATVHNTGLAGQIVSNSESMDTPDIDESVGGGQGGPSSFASTGHRHSNVFSRAINIQAYLNSGAVGGYAGYARSTAVQPTLMLNYIIKVG